MPESPPYRAQRVPQGHNLVWAALGGHQAMLGQTRGDARRLRPSVGPFAGVPDIPTVADWHDLAALAGPGNTVIVFREPTPFPPDWTPEIEWPVFQMVADSVAPPSADEPQPEPLTRADVPAMRALADLTRPGPFREDTIEFGSFLGIRRDGRLVAMAGERFRVPGATEISAVCTHPDARGQGFAGRLTRAVAQRITERGELPFLHVVADNTDAVRLYDGLGFRRDREVVATVVRTPD